MEKVMVAAPAGFDEVCFLIPAWRALVAAGVSVTIIAPAEQVWLWEKLGADILPLSGKESARSLAREIQGKSFALSILWQPGIVADAAARAEIPHRIGWAGEKSLEKRLTHILPAVVGSVRHRVRHYLDAVEGMVPSLQQPEFFAPFARDVAPRGSCLVLADSEWSSNFEWPVESWVEFLTSHPEKSLTFLEYAWQKPRKGGSNAARIVALLGRGEIRRVANWHELFLAAQGCDEALGIEGAGVHLAALAGCRVATWFGPGEPEWRRPLGRQHITLREKVACGPCYLPKCPLDLRCQTRLSASFAKQRLEIGGE